MNRILKIIGELALALLVGALATPILSELAYRERGYIAFGGEWLLIIAIIVVAYLVIRKKDKPEEDEGK